MKLNKKVNRKTLRSTSRQLLTPAMAALALTMAACGGQGDANAPTSLGNVVSDFERVPDREPRVVGGTEVADNRYPWMAALLQRDASNPSEGQFCGGSLIASRWILTAAHCFRTEAGNIDLRASDVSVLLGQQNLAENGGQTINVSRIIEHPDYNANGYPDLALVELSAPSAALPIQLPSRNNPAPNVGESATVTGWGQISENGPATNELRQTTMPVVGHGQCNAAYDGDIVEDAMVCAGTADGSKDSCYGDSGGPLFVSRGGSYVQAGVVSFGEACGLAGVPGVYARVSSYYDWITGYADATSLQSGNGNMPPAGSTPTPAAPAAAPEIVIDASCDALKCAFSASGAATDYYWDFGDGYADQGQSAVHQYNEAGTYTVSLGTINSTGDYIESNTEVAVTGGNDDLASVFEHDGQLQGWGDQIDLPMEQGTVKLNAGTLSASLSVMANRRVLLFVDRYDPQTDEWTEVARVRTRDGEAVLDLPIEAGEYGFTLLSRGRGSWYELAVDVQ